MRKLIIIPCVIGAFVAGACGDRHSQSGDANAAEVTTVTPESSSVATATGATSTQPVSFESANAAYTEKRYDEAVRLFTTYTTDKPDNVWLLHARPIRLEDRRPRRGGARVHAGAREGFDPREEPPEPEPGADRARQGPGSTSIRRGRGDDRFNLERGLPPARPGEARAGRFHRRDRSVQEGDRTRRAGRLVDEQPGQGVHRSGSVRGRA